MHTLGELALQKMFFGIGVGFGLIYYILLRTFWSFFAGPLQEGFLEKFLDPANRRRVKGGPKQLPGNERVADLRELDAVQTILVSDLHVDTWSEHSPKQAAFLGFLEWVQTGGNVGELIINGDICDMPPHPKNQPDVRTLEEDYTSGSGQPKFPDRPESENEESSSGKAREFGVFLKKNDQVFEALARLNQRADGGAGPRVTFTTGNHDIGISGMRFLRQDASWGAARVAWNPAIRLLFRERNVFIEHGHRYDPLLWIYLRYAILELFRDAKGAAGGKSSIGQVNAQEVQKKSIPAMLTAQRNNEPFKVPEIEGFLTHCIRLRYRQAARAVIHMQLDRKLQFLTFGHTHLPDIYTFPGGCTYINSGDWAHDDGHMCFVKIYKDGKMTGPHQWEG